ncbi:MAG TPA: alcohol dehydrogenase catalytic domain-containing protein [Gammaproteobacteria bacterium]|nr:alcohol dehydrogenase catalytic domain-containing protein [Gammaproteobacteria bacterium]
MTTEAEHPSRDEGSSEDRNLSRDESTSGADALSRRSMLKAGVFAAAGLAAARGAAQPEPQAAAPAIATGTVAGRPFRAFVRHGTGSSIEELRLRDIKPRQVLVRTTASCGCYTITRSVLGQNDVAQPQIPNHSGFGVVEAVGSEVHRVRVGDRVVVSGSPECGHCYQCLHGHPEACNYLSSAPFIAPIADMADGTGVVEQAAIGGLSELMVALEEYCVPVFTDLPDAQLALLGDTLAAGLASTMTYAPVEPGSDVVVFGAGPVGLAAVQGARAHSAAQIIVVEPAAYRREAAMKLGATTVLDPNVDTDTLVARIAALCDGPTDRLDAGGRGSNPYRYAGADFVIEASGFDAFPPAVETGPDPTGLLALRQAWDVTRGGGHLTTLAVQRGDISFPASQFCLSTRSIHGGQMGGMHVMRDTPRYVRMIERGSVDAAALIAATYPLEGVVEGFRRVADRSLIGVVFTFG